MFVRTRSGRIPARPPLRLSGCLKLEFQVSRSEIRFDDSTWHCAGRGFVIDRDSRKLRRKYERNAASCWYWLGEKSEADGKRVGEVETRGTRVADGKKRDSDGASNDDESKEEIQVGKEREKGDALGGRGCRV